MNKKFLTYGLLSLSLALSFSCSNEEEITPGVPDTPAEGYRWTFGGGVGTGDATRAGHWTDAGNKLTFGWNYHTENEMVFAVKKKDNSFIQPLKQDDENYPVYYSYMRVLPHNAHDKTNDTHWALFESMEYFEEEQGALAGNSLYAVTPILTSENGSSIANSENEFKATLKMPYSFRNSILPEETLTTNLHPWMYMYAAENLNENGDASLDFIHIPATLRFIFNYNVSESSWFGGIKITRENNGEKKPLAPSSATLTAGKTEDGSAKMDIEYAVDGEYHNEIEVTTRNFKVDFTAPWIFYVLAFPGVTFEDDDRITIKVTIDEDKQPFIAITGKQLYDITGSYQFLPGNLYTFNLNWNGTLSIGSVTVEKWGEGNSMDEGIATPIEATCAIDGKVATISANKYVSSFTDAVNKATAAGCDAIIVEGTLTPDQQAALATALAGYEGTLTLNDVPSTDIIDALNNWVNPAEQPTE